MTGRTWLAVGIVAWTLVAWGGRVRLLTDGEQADPATWVRIGGSLLIGLVAAAALVLLGGGHIERWLLTLFAAWSTVIWLRSLLTVWTDDTTFAFKLVHAVLAAGFLVLAFLSVQVGWSPRTD